MPKYKQKTVKSSLPFSVFIRSGHRYYSVAFKNEKTGGYFPSISTKQETEPACLPSRWPLSGIGRVYLPDLALSPPKHIPCGRWQRRCNLTKTDAEYICQELVRRGFLESYILTETRPAIGFIDFLTEFWDFDKSSYVKEKLRKNHGIHRVHCHQQYNAVQKYWKPFFKERLLGEITQRDIDDFWLFWLSYER